MDELKHFVALRQHALCWRMASLLSPKIPAAFSLTNISSLAITARGARISNKRTSSGVGSALQAGGNNRPCWRGMSALGDMPFAYSRERILPSRARVVARARARASAPASSKQGIYAVRAAWRASWRRHGFLSNTWLNVLNAVNDIPKVPYTWLQRRRRLAYISILFCGRVMLHLHKFEK